MILNRIASTAIYAAPQGETLAFLLYNNAAPPPTLTLGSTWTADAIGYYLFLTTPPAAVDAAVLERQIRAALQPSAPVATGVLWAINDDVSFTMAAILPIAFDKKQRRIVTVDTQIPSGVPPLGVAAGTVVTAAKDNSTLLLSGVSIALTGPSTRCASFTGLFSIVPPDDSSALKNIVTVQVDPLAEGGSTCIGGFDPTLVLNSGPAGYFISDVDYG